MKGRRRAIALRLAAEAAALNSGGVGEAEELEAIAAALARGTRPTVKTKRGEVFTRICEAYASGWEDLSRLTDSLFEELDPGLRAALTVLLVDLAPEFEGRAMDSAVKWLERVEPDLRVAAVKVLGALAELGSRRALERVLKVLKAEWEVKKVRLAALGSLLGIAESRPEVGEVITSELGAALSKERDPEVRIGILSALISLLERRAPESSFD
ncbi:MAG: hypothetical protein QI223_05180 [Candidatus Korarchaeota archaeon]|nr:hypothetical protein [Candidatus Korarchaeota archaeon]